MYFDVNVSSRFPGSEIGIVEELGHDGICVNTVITPEMVEGYKRPPLDLWGDKKVYERVEVVRYRDGGGGVDVREKLDPDLLAIRLERPEDFKEVVKVSPDVITFDYTKSFLIGRDEVVEATKRNIFFEIPLVHGMYGCGDKSMWMRNARRLLEATGGVNVVVGSGAACSTEMRSRQDVIKILEGLGMSRDGGKRVLLNSARLVRSCDIRRGYVVKRKM
ncbi:ribonuclease P/MRP protein subunit RPP1 [Encephalitozoon cuniculi]|nr:ribonuclease P/MRP protein subunit RPP1 [Encephalitozoon cuniculi]